MIASTSAIDIGVVVLDVVDDRACAAGNGRTSRACRRTPCRTRRLRRRSTSSRRAAPRCRSSRARRRSETRASSPAYSRIHASMLVVVVLPCVPETASTHLSRSTCSASHCGPDEYALPESSNASTTGLPRDSALPTTTLSTARVDRRVVAVDELDAERFELRAHRRIDVLIGARDVVPGLFRDGRDAAHEGSADAEDVNAHQLTGWSSVTWRLSISSAYPITIGDAQQVRPLERAREHEGADVDRPEREQEPAATSAGSAPGFPGPAAARPASAPAAPGAPLRSTSAAEQGRHRLAKTRLAIERSQQRPDEPNVEPEDEHVDRKPARRPPGDPKDDEVGCRATARAATTAGTATTACCRAPADAA